MVEEICRILSLAVLYKGVYRDVHFYAPQMRIIDGVSEFIGRKVGGRRSCAQNLRSEVDCVAAVLDSSYKGFSVACRGEEFGSVGRWHGDRGCETVSL